MENLKCISYKFHFLIIISIFGLLRRENKEHLAYTVAIPPCAIPSVKTWKGKNKKSKNRESTSAIVWHWNDIVGDNLRAK